MCADAQREADGVAGLDGLDADDFQIVVDCQNGGLAGGIYQVMHRRMGNVSEFCALVRKSAPGQKVIAQTPPLFARIAAQDALAFEGDEETVKGALGQLKTGAQLSQAPCGVLRRKLVEDLDQTVNCLD